MNKWTWLITLFAVLLLISTFSFGAIPTQEREALIALYNATDGDNWTNNSGWKTPPIHTDGFAMPGTEGNWFGIIVSGDSVVQIDISWNALAGNIPPELGNLGNLQQLYLYGNQLSGSIPPELGDLSNLQQLHLYNNQLSGSIPAKLGNLSNLRELWLPYNQLSGNIPPELGNLTNLEHLYLTSNQLSGSIPPELGNLSNLKQLNMLSNQLSDNIPPQLGNLSNLWELELANNKLSGSIPPELGSLSNLQQLLLNGNQLSGSIPPELGNLSNLHDLNLHDNQFSGSIPPELGNLSNLAHLHLGSNQLSGSIPSELGNLSNLVHLYLAYNQLSGSISPELGNLSNLQQLHLYSNQLSGSIPPELGNLSNLYGLDLHVNQLSGEIPSSLTNLTNIEWFDISFNCLYATDPTLREWINANDPDWESTQNQCGGTNPTININRKEMRFTATLSGNVTKPQEVWITTSGGEILNWTVTVDASWLICTPMSGTGNSVITTSVDHTGLAQGSYSGTITVTDTDENNSPQTIAVTLEVISDNQDKKPFGTFSTPVDGSKVSSSIPVTGWVLDDVGIESVKIYREEGNKSLVYIGDGVFVEGARPDVETAYPDYPNNYKAGWGYMLLTNFLPNNGNGKFTLHAIAADVGEKTVTLGTKTITVDNVNAVKPFGAIDTPIQGGTVSGGSFVNWGWALTPQPNSIPVDGSTIKVWVDGIEVGHPTYNLYRKDIAALFPDYANSNGAVGYFYLDTTAYENGVHTIQWTATDDAGNNDGIGSRYFTIQNTGNSQSKTQTSSSREMVTDQKFFHLSQIVNIPLNNSESIRIKRGIKDDIEPEVVSANESGNFIIKIEELERLIIEFSKRSAVIEGYTIVRNELRPLPIGSIIDSKEKKFYWQPGPGFVCYYRFVFIERSEDNQIRKKNIIVNIVPNFTK